MNMVMDCDIVLSKKIEAICEDGEPISIHITSVNGNKGKAIVRLSCKNGLSEQEILKIGETSIMFKINVVTDDVKSLSDSHRFTNFIGNGVPQEVEPKIAKISPDIPEGLPYKGKDPEVKTSSEAIQEVFNNPEALKLILAALSSAGIPVQTSEKKNIVTNDKMVVEKRDVKTIEPAKKIQDDCIMSYDELINEINNIPNINKDISLPSNRKLTRGEATNVMAQIPKLRRKAYLRNNLQSQFIIADLFTSIDGGGNSLAILPGAAFDLTSIPARNILNSSELKWSFDTGKVSLISKEAYIASFKKMEDDLRKWDQDNGLPVYGGTKSRTNPNELSETVAELVAKGSLNEEMLVDTSDPNSIVVGEETQDVPILFEESPIMQTIINSLPR